MCESSFLPKKATYRVSEVANYYGVTERTVYLWIEQNKLETIQTPGGQSRITREALNKCLFPQKKKKKTMKFTEVYGSSCN